MSSTTHKTTKDIAIHERCSSRSALFALCFALSLSALPQAALAASKKSNSGDATTSVNNTRTAGKKKHKVHTTHLRSPSEETTAERDRRLYRECRGMPNAGACLGYTHK